MCGGIYRVVHLTNNHLQLCMRRLYLIVVVLLLASVVSSMPPKGHRKIKVPGAKNAYIPSHPLLKVLAYALITPWPQYLEEISVDDQHHFFAPDEVPTRAVLESQLFSLIVQQLGRPLYATTRNEVYHPVLLDYEEYMYATQIYDEYCVPRTAQGHIVPISNNLVANQIRDYFRQHAGPNMDATNWCHIHHPRHASDMNYFELPDVERRADGFYMMKDVHYQHTDEPAAHVVLVRRDTLGDVERWTGPRLFRENYDDIIPAMLCVIAAFPPMQWYVDLSKPVVNLNELWNALWYIGADMHGRVQMPIADLPRRESHEGPTAWEEKAKRIRQSNKDPNHEATKYKYFKDSAVASVRSAVAAPQYATQLNGEGWQCDENWTPSNVPDGFTIVELKFARQVQGEYKCGNITVLSAKLTSLFHATLLALQQVSETNVLLNQSDNDRRERMCLASQRRRQRLADSRDEHEDRRMALLSTEELRELAQTYPDSVPRTSRDMRAYQAAQRAESRASKKAEKAARKISREAKRIIRQTEKELDTRVTRVTKRAKAKQIVVGRRAHPVGKALPIGFETSRRAKPPLKQSRSVRTTPDPPAAQDEPSEAFVRLHLGSVQTNQRISQLPTVSLAEAKPADDSWYMEGDSQEDEPTPDQRQQLDAAIQRHQLYEATQHGRPLQRREIQAGAVPHGNNDRVRQWRPSGPRGLEAQQPIDADDPVLREYNDDLREDRGAMIGNPLYDGSSDDDDGTHCRTRLCRYPLIDEETDLIFNVVGDRKSSTSESSVDSDETDSDTSVTS